VKVNQNERIVIEKNVSIEGIYVGGLTVEEAVKRLQSKREQILKKKVIFKCLGREFSCFFKEAGIEVDINGAVEQALRLRKKSSSLLIRDGKKEYVLKLPLVLNKKTAGKYLEKIAAEINHNPVDARYFLNNGKPKVLYSSSGRRVDIEATIEYFQKILNSTDSESKKSLIIPVIVDTVEPRVKTKDIEDKKINVLRGTYTTKFNERFSSRVNNIAAAAEAINGVVIPPGFTFSFNETVGPRTEENGYEEALVIVKNEFVEGVGGGVCQASTTLYNAALRANLDIKERYKHSKLVNYVPPGLDAAVAFGFLDLKLSNNTESYLVINAQVENNSLTINIFGEAGIWPKVKIRHYIMETIKPKTVYEYDPEMEEGKEFVEQEGKVGYITRVERICTFGNKIITREIISEDKYSAEPKVILKGIKKKKSN